MATMTRSEKAAARKAAQERIDKTQAAARLIVQTGKCPDCGAPLRRNMSMSGWWQCEQLGAVGWRKDSSKPACSFQCFTA